MVCGVVLRRTKVRSMAWRSVESGTRGGRVADAKDQRQGGMTLDVMVDVFARFLMDHM